MRSDDDAEFRANVERLIGRYIQQRDAAEAAYEDRIATLWSEIHDLRSRLRSTGAVLDD